jgi:hypothetical protein
MFHCRLCKNDPLKPDTHREGKFLPFAVLLVRVPRGSLLYSPRNVSIYPLHLNMRSLAFASLFRLANGRDFSRIPAARVIRALRSLVRASFP